MQLFQVQDQVLKEIREEPFALEKNVQSLIEHNLPLLFGLTFVSSEFTVKNFRIDTLAYDDEAKTFVIIEYKRDRNSSVIDQGYSYLSLLRNNPSEFILEYQERIGKLLKKSDVELDISRVIFVAYDFTPHQQQAIQFQDLPIELWKVKRYAGNILCVDSIETPSSSARIESTEKTTEKRKHNTEFKKFIVEDLIKKEWTSTRDLYEQLKENVSSFDDRVNENIQRGYIAFRIGWKNMCYMHFNQKGIRCEFTRTKPEDVVDLKKKLEYMKGSMEHYNQPISVMHIYNNDDAQYATHIFSQVYEKLYK